MNNSSGNHSTDSVRQYKQPNEDHFKKVSKILQPPPVLQMDSKSDIENKIMEPAEKKVAVSVEKDGNGYNQNPLAPINKLGTCSSFNASGGGTIMLNFN